MKDYTNKDVILVKKDDVYYLQFKILNKYSDKLRHAVTLRHGGVSKFPTDSLSFRTLGSDSKENVFKNLGIICDKVGINRENVCKARQAHTDNVLVLDNNNKEKYNFKNLSCDKYDGYVITEKNIASFVTTADCNGIIIYDKKQNIVSCVHSGWRGTVKRIYLKAINILKDEFNSKVEDLIFCITPSIRKCCFSSDEEDFKKNFTSIWKNEEEYIFYEKDSNRFHVDLVYLIKKDILDAGLKEENIADANICTMCNNSDFFSYRASLKEKQGDFGTMATIVELA